MWYAHLILLLAGKSELQHVSVCPNAGLDEQCFEAIVPAKDHVGGETVANHDGP